MKTFSFSEYRKELKGKETREIGGKSKARDIEGQ